MQGLRDWVEQRLTGKGGNICKIGVVTAWTHWSRSENQFYIVIRKKTEGGHEWACSCKGYLFGHICSHIKEIW